MMMVVVDVGNVVMVNDCYDNNDNDGDSDGDC